MSEVTWDSVIYICICKTKSTRLKYLVRMTKCYFLGLDSYLICKKTTVFSVAFYLFDFPFSSCIISWTKLVV